jgi:hypothetical protein
VKQEGLAALRKHVTIVLMPLLVALTFGPLIALVDYVAQMHVTHRYEPPLSQAEMQQWEEGSVPQLKAELAKREVPYSKAQWLADSIGQRYFWIGLEKMSLVPVLGVFLACISVTLLDRYASKR